MTRAPIMRELDVPTVGSFKTSATAKLSILPVIFSSPGSIDVLNLEKVIVLRQKRHVAANLKCI